MPANTNYGTGRRKTSVARVRISAGSGKIHDNGRTFELHFPKRFTLWMQALRLLPDRLFFALVRRVTQ